MFCVGFGVGVCVCVGKIEKICVVIYRKVPQVTADRMIRFKSTVNLMNSDDYLRLTTIILIQLFGLYLKKCIYMVFTHMII